MERPFSRTAPLGLVNTICVPYLQPNWANWLRYLGKPRRGSHGHFPTSTRKRCHSVWVSQTPKLQTNATRMTIVTWTTKLQGNCHFRIVPQFNFRFPFVKRWILDILRSSRLNVTTATQRPKIATPGFHTDCNALRIASRIPSPPDSPLSFLVPCVCWYAFQFNSRQVVTFSTQWTTYAVI